MIDRIIRLLSEIDNLKANNSEEYEVIRIKYLSKKGIISSLMSEFRDVPPEQKKEVGKKLNLLKAAFQDRINELKKELDNSLEQSADYDLSRSSYPTPLGTRHPISLVKEEICNIFNRLGFSIADGPEIEDDWHVFSSLNFADDDGGGVMDVTLQMIIQLVICKTLFLFRIILKLFYAHTPLRCKLA